MEIFCLLKICKINILFIQITAILVILKHLDYTNTILPRQIPDILPKGSCLGALVLKSGIFRFYAPLRIPSKRNAAKPCLQHGFWVVKFWNCQSHIAYEIFNFQTTISPQPVTSLQATDLITFKIFNLLLLRQ